MSTFLVSKNNLRDLTDVEKARNHLGIGTLAIQNANDVNITGGSISVSNIILHSDDVEENSFVISLDDKGTLGFFKPDIRNWVYEDQVNIDISSFSNDMGFVSMDELHEVVFSGDYNDLINTPCNVEDLFNESVFLLKQNNLSDLENIDIAKENLGLGPFASFQNTDEITISNLYVINNFHFMPDRTDCNIYKEKYLRLTDSNEDDGSIKTEWVDLPIAGKNNNTYGLLTITNDFTSKKPFTAPSSKALYDAYTDLSSKIANTTDQQFMIDLINDHGLLVKHNNLSEFSEYIYEVKSNLNIGNLSEQNMDDVHIENLTITDTFKFSKLPYEGAFLKCQDAFGSSEWANLPIAKIDSLGSVLIVDDIHYNEQIDNTRIGSTVLNVFAFSNMYNEISNDIQFVSDNVPTKVRDLEDWRDFCLISDGFENIDSDKAKTNLKLAAVAWTGDYASLTNEPVSLSEFHNDTFLTMDNNLLDIYDKAEARINLGIGTMATQNSNDVRIENGTAAFENLTVTDTFVFNFPQPEIIDLENQVYYLGADNTAGKVAWRKIIEATEELYGVVQLTHDIENTESLHKVASATAVSKVYTILNSRINDINISIEDIKSRLR